MGIIYGWDYGGIQSPLLPQLSLLTVGRVLDRRLRRWWSTKVQRILPLALVYPYPPPLPSPAVSFARVGVKPQHFTEDLQNRLRAL